VKTFADCEANTQLFISYGPYSNRELLLNYGFMTNNNPYDRLRISFEVPMDPYYEIREQYLQKFQLPLDHYLRRGPLSTQLMATLRVCALNEEDFGESIQNNLNPLEKISDQNECNMKKMLSNVLIKLDEEFHIDEKDNALSWALQYVENQKEILKFTSKMLE